MSYDKTLIDFKKLQSYVDDVEISDIKCNSKSIWIKHISKGASCLDFNLNQKEIEVIARQIANQVDAVFNEVDPVIEADYADLRVQILHHSVSPSGMNMTIRKTPFNMRIDASKVAKNKYCTAMVMELIKNSVKQKMGIVNCGETGSGKTELMKLENSFIPAYQGIVTIEDTSELHLSTLFKDRNIIELKTNGSFFDFDMANRSTMRMDPDWVELSEARGVEIEKLMFCRSVGHGILTTIHMLNSTSLAQRIMNMFDPLRRPSDQVLTDMVFDYFDIVIHICCEYDLRSTQRFIDEISIYERVDQKNVLTTVYKANKGLKNVQYCMLPTSFSNRLDKKVVASWNALCK